jgi:hypothetical protein
MAAIEHHALSELEVRRRKLGLSLFGPRSAVRHLNFDRHAGFMMNYSSGMHAIAALSQQ